MSALRDRGVTVYVQVSGSEHVMDTRVKILDVSGATLFEAGNIRSLSKTEASPAILSRVLGTDLDDEDF